MISRKTAPAIILIGTLLLLGLWFFYKSLPNNPSKPVPAQPTSSAGEVLEVPKKAPVDLLKDLVKQTDKRQLTGELVDCELYFYNVVDGKDAPPLMIITLVALPKRKTEQANKIQSRIQDELDKSGGVYEDKDYEKLKDIILNFVKELTSLGSDKVDIRFPRVRKGILLRK